MPIPVRPLARSELEPVSAPRDTFATSLIRVRSLICSDSNSAADLTVALARTVKLCVSLDRDPAGESKAASDNVRDRSAILKPRLASKVT